MKPYELPAHQNPLVTRGDLQALIGQILEPLAPRYINGGAGLHLGNSSAHYAARVAAMEGWSRIVWGLAPLVAGGGTWDGLGRHVDGLRHGTDPKHPGYWGEPGDCDQRHVEMAAIALGLLIAPADFWDPLGAAEKDRLCAWLDFANTRELVKNNWQFFRVLVNLALIERGRPHNEAKLQESLDFIDSQYCADGWYADAGQFDFYNPFAFHFYGLIYARFQEARDPERSERYRQRGRAFAGQILPWCHGDGSMVPYGRSLTYRFATASYFAACAFAGLEALPWGVLKGLVLRNLRWWFRQPILDHDGVLSIGYAYPNLIMAEQYNSPTSPYWACKTFLILALPESHPFWAAAELPLPELPATIHLPVPHYVVQRTAGDTVLLNAGHYAGFELVQNAAKYAKFAYSCRFGFSVSHGGYGLEQTGCDSMLVLSLGDNYWRERRQVTEQSSGPGWVHGRWRPWPHTDIHSWVLALGDWQVRLHRISSTETLDLAEGGFAAPLCQDFGPEECREIEDRRRSALDGQACPGRTASGEDAGAARYDGFGASSLIVDLTSTWGPGRRGGIVAPEPNLNLMNPRVRIPVLRGRIGPGTHFLACAVWAGDTDGLARAAGDLPVLQLADTANEARLIGPAGTVTLSLEQP
jgi:hypothetical protein